MLTIRQVLLSAQISHRDITFNVFNPQVYLLSSIFTLPLKFFWWLAPPSTRPSKIPLGNFFYLLFSDYTILISWLNLLVKNNSNLLSHCYSPIFNFTYNHFWDERSKLTPKGPYEFQNNTYIVFKFYSMTKLNTGVPPTIHICSFQLPTAYNGLKILNGKVQE